MRLQHPDFKFITPSPYGYSGCVTRSGGLSNYLFTNFHSQGSNEQFIFVFGIGNGLKLRTLKNGETRIQGPEFDSYQNSVLFDPETDAFYQGVRDKESRRKIEAVEMVPRYPYSHTFGMVRKLARAVSKLKPTRYENYDLSTVSVPEPVATLRNKEDDEYSKAMWGIGWEDALAEYYIDLAGNDPDFKAFVQLQNMSINEGKRTTLSLHIIPREELLLFDALFSNARDTAEVILHLANDMYKTGYSLQSAKLRLFRQAFGIMVMEIAPYLQDWWLLGGKFTHTGKRTLSRHGEPFAFKLVKRAHNKAFLMLRDQELAMSSDIERGVFELDKVEVNPALAKYKNKHLKLILEPLYGEHWERGYESSCAFWQAQSYDIRNAMELAMETYLAPFLERWLDLGGHLSEKKIARTNWGGEYTELVLYLESNDDSHANDLLDKARRRAYKVLYHEHEVFKLLHPHKTVTNIPFSYS